MNHYRLNNGVEIPVLGFGTWKAADGEEAYQAVLAALKAGYRHIDTAAIYQNEESVGRAIKDSGLAREGSDVPAPYDILGEGDVPGLTGDGSKDNPYTVSDLSLIHIYRSPHQQYFANRSFIAK